MREFQRQISIFDSLTGKTGAVSVLHRSFVFCSWFFEIGLNNAEQGNISKGRSLFLTIQQELHEMFKIVCGIRQTV